MHLADKDKANEQIVIRCKLQQTTQFYLRLEVIIRPGEDHWVVRGRVEFSRHDILHEIKRVVHNAMDLVCVCVCVCVCVSLRVKTREESRFPFDD